MDKEQLDRKQVLMNRRQVLIDEMELKKIEEKINNIEGISIINVYKRIDICEKYIEEMKNICTIGFPVFTRKAEGDKKYRYIEYLYKLLKLQTSSYNWLIPNFNNSYWWLELEINNLCNFIDFYYLGNILVELTAIDTRNKLLFDIDRLEDDFEYCVIWL